MWKYIILIMILFTFFGCDNRTTEPEIQRWSWVQVYEDDVIIHEGKLDMNVDSTNVVRDLLDGSHITLNKYVNVYYPCDPTLGEDEIDRVYIILAEKENYFTRFYQCSYQDTIIIDVVNGLSPTFPGIICGTLFTSNHIPASNNFFDVLQDSNLVCAIETNEFGYFSNDSLIFGDYQIIEEEYYEELFFSDFIVTSFYDDYYVSIFEMCLKPNIYLYPTKKINLDISLSFTDEGKVTTSIPDYGTGWKNLQIDPSGMINDEYSYLFYESIHPDLYQYKQGWVIQQKDLESFFIQNLTETGFEGQEIIDFTDYWIPLLKDYSYYAIYPQYNEQLSKMTRLEFSTEPENLLRLIYSVEGREDDSLVLHKPIIPEFKREGFFVVEWGVSFRNNDLFSTSD